MKTCLIVDDSKVIRKVARHILETLEFLKLLRQRGHSDQPKVVFCTTENDMAHIRAALEAGADEYVMKPFDRETLHIKLQLVGVA